MITLSPDNELTAIHFNNRSIAPIIDVPYSNMLNYYKAYRKFSSIIDNSSMAFTFKLNPGDGAFYGPKIDVQIWSIIGREFTLATNQVDFAQGKRFNLNFTNKDKQNSA